jgi:hypothetical protein
MAVRPKTAKEIASASNGRFAPEAAGRNHHVRSARSSLSKAARGRNIDFREPADCAPGSLIQGY